MKKKITKEEQYRLAGIAAEAAMSLETEFTDILKRFAIENIDQEFDSMRVFQLSLQMMYARTIIIYRDAILKGKQPFDLIEELNMLRSKVSQLVNTAHIYEETIQ